MITIHKMHIHILLIASFVLSSGVSRSQTFDAKTRENLNQIEADISRSDLELQSANVALQQLNSQLDKINSDVSASVAAKTELSKAINLLIEDTAKLKNELKLLQIKDIPSSENLLKSFNKRMANLLDSATKATQSSEAIVAEIKQLQKRIEELSSEKLKLELGDTTQKLVIWCEVYSPSHPKEIFKQSASNKTGASSRIELEDSACRAALSLCLDKYADCTNKSIYEDQASAARRQEELDNLVRSLRKAKEVTLPERQKDLVASNEILNKSLAQLELLKPDADSQVKAISELRQRRETASAQLLRCQNDLEQKVSVSSEIDTSIAAKQRECATIRSESQKLEKQIADIAANITIKKNKQTSLKEELQKQELVATETSRRLAAEAVSKYLKDAIPESVTQATVIGLEDGKRSKEAYLRRTVQEEEFTKSSRGDQPEIESPSYKSGFAEAQEQITIWKDNSLVAQEYNQLLQETLSTPLAKTKLTLGMQQLSEEFHQDDTHLVLMRPRIIDDKQSIPKRQDLGEILATFATKADTTFNYKAIEAANIDSERALSLTHSKLEDFKDSEINQKAKSVFREEFVKLLSQQYPSAHERAYKDAYSVAFERGYATNVTIPEIDNLKQSAVSKGQKFAGYQAAINQTENNLEKIRAEAKSLASNEYDADFNTKMVVAVENLRLENYYSKVDASDGTVIARDRLATTFTVHNHSVKPIPNGAIVVRYSSADAKFELNAPIPEIPSESSVELDKVLPISRDSISSTLTVQVLWQPSVEVAQQSELARINVNLNDFQTEFFNFKKVASEILDGKHYLIIPTTSSYQKIPVADPRTLKISGVTGVGFQTENSHWKIDDVGIAKLYVPYVPGNYLGSNVYSILIAEWDDIDAKLVPRNIDQMGRGIAFRAYLKSEDRRVEIYISRDNFSSPPCNKKPVVTSLNANDYVQDIGRQSLLSICTEFLQQIKDFSRYEVKLNIEQSENISAKSSGNCAVSAQSFNKGYVYNCDFSVIFAELRADKFEFARPMVELIENGIVIQRLSIPLYTGAIWRLSL